MKALGSVTPTAEQLTVIEDATPGFWLIRGAAGSGKTTTALLRLRFLVRLWRERRADLGLTDPVRVLVLTFNRTLRGYIQDLADQQIVSSPDVSLEVSTFGHWAIDRTGAEVVDRPEREAELRRLARAIPLSDDFVIDEVDYLLGRFLPDELERYIEEERTGRGAAPRVDRTLRRRLLDEVVTPYIEWKTNNRRADWNDLAVMLAEDVFGDLYDVVIVDEAQDFSANQVRAIVNHLADEHVTTFIRDSVQRIYPNSFLWRDVNVVFPPGHSKRLQANHRNTPQIARFARPLVAGLDGAEDSALPDFLTCTATDGPVPQVVQGSYSNQLDFIISVMRSGRIRAGESVAFLHPRGGGWFSALRTRLKREAIPWVSITRESDWPAGPEDVALSTMHSAKGLEFDHVFVLGYNAEVVEHGDDDEDNQLLNHRRLLAMSIGRARRSVVIGYKPDDAADAVLDLLDPATYESIRR